MAQLLRKNRWFEELAHVHEMTICVTTQCRNGEGEPSPSNSRGATLNSTAQRYAAYRLRAAQGE